MGNLTRVPELRHIPSGLAVSDIGLAVNDKRKLQTGELVDEVTFVDITLWGRTAEVVCEHLTKGSPLLVEGRLKLDSWDDKEGQKRSKLKVIGETIQLLGPRSGGGGGGGRGRDEEGSRYYSSQSNDRNPGRSNPPQQQDYDDSSSDGNDVPF